MSISIWLGCGFLILSYVFSFYALYSTGKLRVLYKSPEQLLTNRKKLLTAYGLALHFSALMFYSCGVYAYLVFKNTILSAVIIGLSLATALISPIILILANNIDEQE